MEYAQSSSHQKMNMLQLDFAHEFDTVKWKFMFNIMGKMGFGPKMANIIFLLTEHSQSCLSINDKLIDPILIKPSVKQDFPLSPLLFDVGTHPLFCMLERFASIGEIHGLRIHNKNMMGLGFADDTLLFLKACNLNIASCLTLLGRSMLTCYAFCASFSSNSF